MLVYGQSLLDNMAHDQYQFTHLHQKDKRRTAKSKRAVVKSRSLAQAPSMAKAMAMHHKVHSRLYGISCDLE